jgi:hypothetical protein
VEGGAGVELTPPPPPQALNEIDTAVKQLDNRKRLRITYPR